MKYTYLLGCLLISCSVLAQKKFIAEFDTTLINDNPYIQQYTTTTFWQQPFTQELIDPNNINEDLLEAVIFFKINQLRGKKKMRYLQHNSKLSVIAQNYIQYDKRKKRVTFLSKKIVKKAAEKMGYYGGFIDMNGGVASLLKQAKQHTILTENGQRIFYHGTPKRVAKSKKPIPIAKLSYANWAKQFKRRWLASAIKNKAFSDIGCAVKLINVNNRFIPSAKVVVIVGGYRLEMLSDSQ